MAKKITRHVLRNAFFSSLALPVAALAQVQADFDPPVALTSDGAPFTGILFPSPTLHDLDGDGKRELVIGDLPGRIVFARPGDGIAKWQKREPLQSNKKPLKLNNW